MKKLPLTPQYNALESARITFELRKLAQDFSNQEGFDKSLASVMLYASFVEFIMVDIEQRITSKITDACSRCYQENITYRVNNERNRNRDKLERIKQYTFPYSVELIQLLGTLKSDRDDLFHNIVDAHDKGIIVDSTIKRIQSNSEKIIDLWGKFIVSTSEII